MVPRPPLADPELFRVDASGDAGVRNAILTEFNQGGVSRRRKGATKPLKAAQIIADRDGATRLALTGSETRMAKRKREREAGISTDLKRKLDRLAKRPSKGEGLWSVSTRTRPDDLGLALNESGVYDAWTLDIVEERKRDAIPEEIRDIVSVKKPKAPRSLRRHDRLVAQPVPVATPHPGSSYNPTQDEHQHLLRVAHEEAQREEAKLDADREARARIEAARLREKGKELWEHAEMDVDRRSQGSDEEIKAGAAPEKRQSKRKPEKARRRAAQNKRSEAVDRQQRLQAKHERQAIAALPGEPRATRRAVALREQKRQARQLARTTALAERGLAGRRVGAGIAPAARLDYQISDELAEDLRSLKAEGSLWRDWAGSATRRGMMEASKRRAGMLKKAKGRSTKVIEKATWRHWAP